MDENLHIIPFKHKVSKKDREALNGHKSKVIWVFGLSGSGKSTIANGVEQLFHKNGILTFLLDGDNVRAGLNKDLDFSLDSRSENIRRVAEVANLFAECGVVCVVAFITPLEKDRELAKSIIGRENVIEVFIDCPLEVCEQRDVKGLYAKARKGEIKNFTGINSPFEKPMDSDIIIDTSKCSVEDSINKIFNHVKGTLD